MQQATETIGFGPEALWIFFGVLIALGGIALLVMNLIKVFRELRKPKVQNEKTVEDKLARDNERLNDLEDLTKKQNKELVLILRTQLAILHHLIDGNGIDGMKRTQRDIENFLINGHTEDEREKGE
jgi:hypothetical protein